MSFFYLLFLLLSNLFFSLFNRRFLRVFILLFSFPPQHFNLFTCPLFIHFLSLPLFSLSTFYLLASLSLFSFFLYISFIHLFYSFIIKLRKNMCICSFLLMTSNLITDFFTWSGLTSNISSFPFAIKENASAFLHFIFPTSSYFYFNDIFCLKSIRLDKVLLLTEIFFVISISSSLPPALSLFVSCYTQPCPFLSLISFSLV